MTQKERKTLSICGIGFLAALAISLPAFAATVPSTIGVSSTVHATCLNTASPMAFGIYTGLQTDTTATITVTCTNTTPYTISLNAGVGISPAATVTTRKMTGTVGAFLNYALYRDAGRTLNWGQTVGTDTVAGTGNGGAQPITVYGREAAGQFVAPGAYTDTVTATVNY
jgi:spore coat protein U-like protein